MLTSACRLRPLTTAVFLASALQAAALINLQYTPADLARDAARIFVVEFDRTADDRLTGEVGAVLKGKGPEGKEFIVSLADSDPAEAGTV